MPADSVRLADHCERLRSGQILSGHPIYSEQNAASVQRSRAESLFIMRDPRDIVVSSAYFAYNLREHAWHERVSQYPKLPDRMALMICGDRRASIPSIRERLKQYAGWLEFSCLPIRFEDLIDPGSRRVAIVDLFARLGTPVNESTLDGICEATVSSVSRTFRRGVSGEWAEVFDERLLSQFNDATKDLMPLYGYSVVDRMPV